MKYAVISSFLGKTKDRFHEYNKALELEEKFRFASEIPDMSGLECVYPYEVNKPEEVRALMAKYKLGISAVNVNVKAEPEFRNGGLTSHDKAVRDKAVRFIKEAKDFAKAIGSLELIPGGLQITEIHVPVILYFFRVAFWFC